MTPSRKSSTPTSPLKFIYCLIGTAALLMVVNVVMSARVAQDGLTIDQLLKQETALKTEIAQLEQNLLTTTSLQDLSAKAKTLGYIEPETTISLTSVQRIAQF